MKKVEQNKQIWISAKDVHAELGIKKMFATWIKTSINRAELKENVDFIPFRENISVGRPSFDYLLNRDAALIVIMMSGGNNANRLRKEVVEIFNKRQDLELVTVKEAAFAVKVINALKYVENQKEAYSLHQKTFIEHEGMSKYVYADFAKYRAKIVGWDKDSVNRCLDEYLNNHSGFNRNKLSTTSMSNKLSVIDISEAIKVAVLDILFSNGSEEQLAYKFAAFVKSMAKEMDIEPMKRNETNLFQSKEELSINEVKMIGLK